MTSSASPSKPLTPALTAVPFFDDDDDDDDDDEVSLAERDFSADVIAVTVAVAVAVTVIEMVSVLGDVEPDVRL